MEATEEEAEAVAEQAEVVTDKVMAEEGVAVMILEVERTVVIYSRQIPCVYRKRNRHDTAFGGMGENPKLKDLLDLEARQEQEETKEAKEGIASSSTNPTERAIDDAPSSIPQGLRSDAITASESG
ncbi:hypothetical protein Acr_15g0006060 [Actinidia rufa]|uniref:Uncharacterized protein n=1 Tax=Actinidia rufa TaxID=165716 RepID=A0A7J0FU86_9ERIC|nr:hypothetical protein Acr_15g0006060 [Actinidia rufa]